VSQTITVNPGANTDFTIASNTQSLTLQAGQSGTVTITVTPSGGFDSQVIFSCGQQTLVTCTFTPSTLVPNGNPISTTLTVTASSAIANQAPPVAPALPPWSLLSLALAATLCMLCVVISRQKSLKTPLARALLPFCGDLIIAPLAGCGGGTPGPQTSTVTITATAGGNSHNLALTITVTH